MKKILFKKFNIKDIKPSYFFCKKAFLYGGLYD